MVRVLIANAQPARTPVLRDHVGGDLFLQETDRHERAKRASFVRFFNNAVTATRHPVIALEYARWKIGEIIGRPLLAHGVFGTRLQTPSYTELIATRGLTPGPSEARMIRNLSSNCPLFIDIGANVGVWTVALAAAHPKAAVYCFEPTPGIFDVLRNNVALNRLRNVTAAQLAVSESAGVLLFQTTGENTSYLNRLTPRKESAEDLHRGRFTNARTIEVKSIRLDDFCQDRGIDRIGFLKIDVEGAEVSVLRGAEHLLQNRAIELIWIEVEPDNLREMGESVESLALITKKMGYTFHILQPDGSCSPPVDIRYQRSPNMVARPE
jgi:FkbM family methyltransferase